MNKEIEQRLLMLQVDYEEDYNKEISMESIDMFVRFMTRLGVSNKPIITATPNGDICAEWKNKNKAFNYFIVFNEKPIIHETG